jgi:hypothetical protein
LFETPAKKNNEDQQSQSGEKTQERGGKRRRVRMFPWIPNEV